jgi:ABC-type nitrate/sulfonate/bicarbonate transport system ATPase subunit
MAGELGLASVVITHDVDEAVSLASRVYVLRGNPSAGVPSRIVAQVDVPRPTSGVPFELSHAYVDAKREVLSFLG